MYSLLEQHRDGTWWYHPGDTFETETEVEQRFQESFRHDQDRPHRTFKHDEPLFQDYATCTYNFRTFEFGGMIHWPKSLKGTFVGR